VPVQHLFEEGVQEVIAIAVDRDIALCSELQTAVDIYVRAGEIQGFHLEKYSLENADIVIRPQIGDIHWTDFSRSEELISLWEKAAAMIAFLKYKGWRSESISGMYWMG